MPDWSASMTQTFEYYIVNPNTWTDDEPLKCVTKCQIKRDLDSQSLGSASLTVAENIGEVYVRIYLVTVQNGVRERFPLGTFITQTPSESFDGKIGMISIDAYTPLIELKEVQPPIGYTVPKGAVTMKMASDLCEENMRAPVVGNSDQTKSQIDFVADTNDTWLSYISALVSTNKFRLDLDEVGRVLFAPEQELERMQPVFTYNDDNASILQPQISIDRDLYGIPNVVEVMYSQGTGCMYAKAENNDISSPTSIQNRGRRIVQRVTDPNLNGIPSKDELTRYAERTLSNASTLEYKLSYTHGYCPVRIGDCVRLNYTKAGLVNVKARVISQSITCDTGCQIEETAVYTSKLWR